MFTSLYDGNLLDLIENQKSQFSSRKILRIADSVLNALVLLHTRNLIHRDVKSANVFYEIVNGKMNYVLGDFGESKILPKKITGTLTGTTRWIAPEVFDTKGYSFEADIWSFGMLL